MVVEASIMVMVKVLEKYSMVMSEEFGDKNIGASSQDLSSHD